MLDRPRDYCDHYCERCPQRPRCDLAALEEHRAHEFPNVSQQEWMEHDLRAAFAMLERALEEQGIDPDTIEAPDPPPEARELAELGQCYAMALSRVSRAAPMTSDREALSQLQRLGLVVAGKCAALVDAFEEPDDELIDIWASQVFILEAAAAAIHRHMATVLTVEVREMFGPIHQRLDELLRPLDARIPAPLRDLLAKRIAEGEAPSPFLVRSAPWAELRE
ncbi:MAG: hypothetical protein JJ863_15765 [Deltaproteobacteria bacterium]|nr:hypothetical protein [Deltaproteobacteria bacterium]